MNGSALPASSAAYKRAAAVLERTERLAGGDGRPQLVEITRIFGFFGLLDLEQVRGVQDAAIGPDNALAVDLVFGIHRLHLGDDGLAVRGTADGGDRF
jgi:hypothetical protein